MAKDQLPAEGRFTTISVMSPYGLALVCAVVGFVLSRLVTRYVIDLGWRRVIFSVGAAAAIVYLGAHLGGSDEWSFYAAILYSAGALLGWIGGFGIAMLPRRRQRRA